MIVTFHDPAGVTFTWMNTRR